MNGKNFKGWGVLVAAFIMAFFPMAIMSNCFSLYMAPVCKDLGFSNAGWSVVNMIAAFAGAFGAMVFAKIFQKKNMKATMVIATIGTSLCWVIAAYCTQIWQFYLVFAVANMLMAGITQLPISTLVTAWFEEQRATMLAIAYTGSSLGGTVFSPVVSRFIASKTDGWKAGMLFTAVTVAVIMVLTIIFLVKRSPEEYGTEPYRNAAATSKEKKSKENAGVWAGLSKKEAVKSRAWRFVIGVVVSIGILSAGVMTHVPNFVTSVAQDGGSLQGAVLAIYYIVAMIGGIVGGLLIDKLGVRISVLLGSILVILAMGSLYTYSLTGVTFLTYAFSLTFGFAMFLPRVLPAVLVSNVFGTKDYADIYAFSNLFFLVGAALGSVLTSILQGIAGYGNTWIIYMFVAIALFFFVSGAIRNSERLREKNLHDKPLN